VTVDLIRNQGTVSWGGGKRGPLALEPGPLVEYAVKSSGFPENRIRSRYLKGPTA